MNINKSKHEHIPSLAGHCAEAKTCIYTMTPDENFILGHHPKHKEVVIAAGFSGHGYRFASVFGEALALLATDQKIPYSIELFSPSRFFTGS